MRQLLFQFHSARTTTTSTSSVGQLYHSGNGNSITPFPHPLQTRRPACLPTLEGIISILCAFFVVFYVLFSFCFITCSNNFSRGQHNSRHFSPFFVSTAALLPRAHFCFFLRSKGVMLFASDLLLIPLLCVEEPEGAAFLTFAKHSILFIYFFSPLAARLTGGVRMDKC